MPLSLRDRLYPGSAKFLLAGDVYGSQYIVHKGWWTALITLGAASLILGVLLFVLARNVAKEKDS